jgi:hypothetical protein
MNQFFAGLVEPLQILKKYQVVVSHGRCSSSICLRFVHLNVKHSSFKSAKYLKPLGTMGAIKNIHAKALIVVDGWHRFFLRSSVFNLPARPD